MQLAADDIVIKHGSDAVRLRPSLRAAMRLERAYGLSMVLHGVITCNFGIICRIIVEGATDRSAVEPVMNGLVRKRGIEAVLDLQEPLITFLKAAYGVEPDQQRAADDRQTGKPRTADQALSDLFEIATGWLGWPPDQAYAATPAEILAAQRGLIAKLKAIHGSADEEQPAYDPREEVPEHEVREGIALLRELSRKAA